MTTVRFEAVTFADDGRLLASFSLPADSGAFAGHFPGVPILPGVLQVDWALRLACENAMIAQPVAQDFRVKFRRPIMPDQAVSLALWHDADRSYLHFEYRTGDGVASLGRIRIG